MSLIHHLDIDEYHADTVAVSKSGLDDLDQSPAHFFARHLDPERPAREPTAAMFTGTLAHCAILEPGEFDKRYPTGPEVATKAAKAWKDFEAKLLPGQIAIKAQERAAAFAQAMRVLRIASISDLLEEGQPEVSAYWTDAASGVACRCRPDWVSPAGEDGVILLDVKTCVDASPVGFAKSIVNWHYAKQAAFYSDGYAAASGLPVYGFVFAAVEKEHPWVAKAYMLSDEDLEWGRWQYARNLATLAECRRTNLWPGYGSEDIDLVTLPAWAKREYA